MATKPRLKKNNHGVSIYPFMSSGKKKPVFWLKSHKKRKK
jgi:hypothetical protein